MAFFSSSAEQTEAKLQLLFFLFPMHTPISLLLHRPISSPLPAQSGINVFILNRSKMFYA